MKALVALVSAALLGLASPGIAQAQTNQTINQPINATAPAIPGDLEMRCAGLLLALFTLLEEGDDPDNIAPMVSNALDRLILAATNKSTLDQDGMIDRVVNYAVLYEPRVTAAQTYTRAQLEADQVMGLDLPYCVNLAQQ